MQERSWECQLADVVEESSLGQHSPPFRIQLALPCEIETPLAYLSQMLFKFDLLSVEQPHNLLGPIWERSDGLTEFCGQQLAERADLLFMLEEPCVDAVQKFVRSTAITWRDDPARRKAYWQWQPGVSDSGLQVGGDLRSIALSRTGCQDHKCIARNSGDQIVRSCGILKGPSDLDQGSVAGAMTKRIIDALELVEVQVQQRERTAGLPVRQFLSKAPDEPPRLAIPVRGSVSASRARIWPCRVRIIVPRCTRPIVPTVVSSTRLIAFPPQPPYNDECGEPGGAQTEEGYPIRKGGARGHGPQGIGEAVMSMG